ncbi:MAG: YdcH family protein [Burkholderiales bacterium]
MEELDIDALKNRINELKIQHRDLDQVIARLSESPTVDQLQMQRLKKRKLLLKDQIFMLEGLLTPDIPA